MVRKSFLVSLVGYVFIVAAIFQLVTVFMKPATGLSIGLAIASVFLLPIAITLIIKVKRGNMPIKKAVSVTWFVWLLLLIAAAIIAYQIPIVRFMLNAQNFK